MTFKLVIKVGSRRAELEKELCGGTTVTRWGCLPMRLSLQINAFLVFSAPRAPCSQLFDTSKTQAQVQGWDSHLDLVAGAPATSEGAFWLPKHYKAGTVCLQETSFILPVL